MLVHCPPRPDQPEARLPRKRANSDIFICAAVLVSAPRLGIVGEALTLSRIIAPALRALEVTLPGSREVRLDEVDGGECVRVQAGLQVDDGGLVQVRERGRIRGRAHCEVACGRIGGRHSARDGEMRRDRKGERTSRGEREHDGVRRPVERRRLAGSPGMARRPVRGL